MNVVELIVAKRDGATLEDEQIHWFLDAYTRGDVADAQASALLMAIFFQGLTPAELASWTAAMIASGERLDLGGIGRPTVDKHSTGGVGDKISLPLVPLVAACGAAVPQLSGRGLGHTGGTLDKLEAIAGLRVALSNDEVRAQLRDLGPVICAAGEGLAPADRKLYALRDVTGTIESIPLIASSIMSKKIAEGTEALVLDVKVGTGAFMTDEGSARELAETMVRIGTDAGVRTVALLTNMDVPLGRTAGNGVEVAETLDVLAGGGPGDVVELTLALAREMVVLAGVGGDPAEKLADGSALAMWRAMIEAQGGDPDAPLPEPKHIEIVRAPSSGYVTRLEARGVGVAAWRLGAGRARKDDPVSASAGVVWHATLGDAVEEGQPLFELRTDDRARLGPALEALAPAWAVGPERGGRPPVVLDRIA